MAEALDRATLDPADVRELDLHLLSADLPLFNRLILVPYPRIHS